MRVFNAIQEVYLEKHGYIQDLEKSLGKDVIIEDQFNKDVEASRAAGYKVMINEIKSEISKIK